MSLGQPCSQGPVGGPAPSVRFLRVPGGPCSLQLAVPVHSFFCVMPALFPAPGLLSPPGCWASTLLLRLSGHDTLWPWHSLLRSAPASPGCAFPLQKLRKKHPIRPWNKVNDDSLGIPSASPRLSQMLQCSSSVLCEDLFGPQTQGRRKGSWALSWWVEAGTPSVWWCTWASLLWGSRD